MRRRCCQHDDLRAAFTTLLRVPEPARVGAGCGRAVGAARGRSRRLGGAARAVEHSTHAEFPGDIGVVLALLLNDVRLEPGEAIFLGAGNVHCYLRGMGVEIMANSDNVLRCGLTPKHVDVAELLRDHRLQPAARAALQPAWRDGMGADFEVPVPDFRLSRRRSRRVPQTGPCQRSCAAGTSGQPYLVLCGSGRAELTVGAERGSALVVPAGPPSSLPASPPFTAARARGRSVLPS